VSVALPKFSDWRDGGKTIEEMLAKLPGEDARILRAAIWDYVNSMLSDYEYDAGYDGSD
jgi:hypothetical protein